MLKLKALLFLFFFSISAFPSSNKLASISIEHKGEILTLHPIIVQKEGMIGKSAAQKYCMENSFDFFIPDLNPKLFRGNIKNKIEDLLLGKSNTHPNKNNRYSVNFGGDFSSDTMMWNINLGKNVRGRYRYSGDKEIDVGTILLCFDGNNQLSKSINKKEKGEFATLDDRNKAFISNNYNGVQFGTELNVNFYEYQENQFGPVIKKAKISGFEDSEYIVSSMSQEGAHPTYSDYKDLNDIYEKYEVSEEELNSFIKSLTNEFTKGKGNKFKSLDDNSLIPSTWKIEIIETDRDGKVGFFLLKRFYKGASIRDISMAITNKYGTPPDYKQGSKIINYNFSIKNDFFRSNEVSSLNIGVEYILNLTDSGVVVRLKYTTGKTLEKLISERKKQYLNENFKQLESTLKLRKASNIDI
ncbi:hypothetical protein [Pseudoalteromonas sp. BDTF-M6]|uniref:hypothetical protein n=1 Tax=Pseudoalteromonas sp. BDTF-M6 TaxID=2796132 RepID=UPI001BB0AA7B|nr:hypothetical protein [Pseudoalteromonas sp. BDTF-M6]MBS3796367.1 hypothetical protein [Pseudoalteromonas sp. BDTF-M6]